jgi:hypothetical protein
MRRTQGAGSAGLDEVDEINQLLDASYLLAQTPVPKNIGARYVTDEPFHQGTSSAMEAIAEITITVDTLVKDVDTLKDRGDIVTNTIDALAKDVDNLKNKGDASTTKFAGLVFKNLEDCFE